LPCCCRCCSALPNPPSSVILTDVAADSVSLGWNSGNVEPVSSYVVQFRAKYPPTAGDRPREGEEAEWSETGGVLRTELTVRGLQAFTAYELRVLAVTSIGRSAPSAAVDVTTAELGLSSLPLPVDCSVPYQLYTNFRRTVGARKVPEVYAELYELYVVFGVCAVQCWTISRGKNGPVVFKL